MKTQIRNILMTLLFVASFSMISFAQEANDKKNWSEVVTSQPKGFAIGEDGNVTISDAEGFAWIISVANGLNGVKQNTLEGKMIFITNDLDMSEYQWMPLKPFNFTIKGDDVKIKGLPVKDLLEKNHTTDFVFHIEGVVFDFKLWSIEFPEK